MNKYQKEYLKQYIKDEEKTLEKIKEVYENALKQVDQKIEELMKHTEMQSKIYQLKYQKALKKQIEAILNDIDLFPTIYDYLENCYYNGYIGVMYDLSNQDIPLIIPIDQEQVVNALIKETKLTDGLYKRLGYNIKVLAKEINEEISKGIATSMSFADVSRNINARFKVGRYKSYLIARTEGHRVMTTASYHAQLQARDKGCDIVKQWDSTLDGRTRPSHRVVDGEIRELDEKFSNGLLYPSDPSGKASEVCNCRCALLQRATWNLGEKELQTQKERAEYFGLDKSKNFNEFKEKYLKTKESED